MLVHAPAISFEAAAGAPGHEIRFDTDNIRRIRALYRAKRLWTETLPQYSSGLGSPRMEMPDVVTWGYNGLHQNIEKTAIKLWSQTAGSGYVVAPRWTQAQALMFIFLNIKLKIFPLIWGSSLCEICFSLHKSFRRWFWTDTGFKPLKGISPLEEVRWDFRVTWALRVFWIYFRTIPLSTSWNVRWNVHIPLLQATMTGRIYDS